MGKEYISKDRVLEMIQTAYRTYLPAYHGPIAFLESGIIQEEPAEVKEIIHAKWIPSHKHMWEKLEDGTVDEWAWENGFHNGPRCVLCYSSPCVNCNPDWENLEDCNKEHYECSQCGQFSVVRTGYCSCGALMDLEDEE